jgi:hypothetical protein
MTVLDTREPSKPPPPLQRLGKILQKPGLLGLASGPRKDVLDELARWESVLRERGELPAGVEDQLRLALDGLAGAKRGTLRLQRARKKVEVTEDGKTRNVWQSTLTIDQELAIEKEIRAGLGQMARALATLGIDGRPAAPDPLADFWRQPTNPPEPVTPPHSIDDAATSDHETTDGLAKGPDAPGAIVDGRPVQPAGTGESADGREPDAVEPTPGEDGGEVGSGEFG